MFWIELVYIQYFNLIGGIKSFFSFRKYLKIKRAGGEGVQWDSNIKLWLLINGWRFKNENEPETVMHTLPQHFLYHRCILILLTCALCIHIWNDCETTVGERNCSRKSGYKHTHKKSQVIMSQEKSEKSFGFGYYT